MKLAKVAYGISNLTLFSFLKFIQEESPQHSLPHWATTILLLAIENARLPDFVTRGDYK
jgi:hypothetical protein